MNPIEINIGDKLQVKKGFISRNSAPVKVKIIDKIRANADGGYIFLTDPELGSGFGLSAWWFEKINDTHKQESPA